jgi:SAM-dependent methyltransferase
MPADGILADYSRHTSAATPAIGRVLRDLTETAAFRINDSLANSPPAGLQQKSAEIAFFDGVTQDGDYDVFTDRGYERILRAFDAHLQPLMRSRKDPLEAVDLGCGTGAFTSRLQRYGFHLHGVDISPQSVTRASQKFPSIDFHVGDIESTPFPGDTFDVVFLSAVLHHFPDLTRTVAECGRILKPGGILLACDPHRGNPAMWLYRCKESPFYSSKGVTENEQPLSKAALHRAFQPEPFEEVRVSAISGITYKHVASRTASLFLPAYNLFDRCFDLPLVRDRFGSFLITYARKRA